MPLTNADKQEHGQSAQKGMNEILKRCKEAGYIIGSIKKYRTGREGYNNSKQFYTPFVICFPDGSKWAVFTTTSMRTDRIKGQQWDAINLKEIDTHIRRVYLVYPDGVSEHEKSEFIRQNNKYVNHDEYSAIDGVISQNQIRNYIEEVGLSHLNDGQIRDRLGNDFEDRIATILKYPENLQKWKTNSPTLEGMHYDVFELIVSCLGINRQSATVIDATSDKRTIGRLPSGGNPKTDVLVTVHFEDGTEKVYTISCKRTGENYVSVHQYSADSFADVLNSEDNNLRTLLNEFQRCGNLRDFGNENKIALENALAPYLEALSMWVLGGFGGEGSEKQCAQYILTYNNNTDACSIFKTDDYYQNLVSKGVAGHFGTLFTWTYPSGRKGSSIQLKMRII